MKVSFRMAFGLLALIIVIAGTAYAGASDKLISLQHGDPGPPALEVRLSNGVVTLSWTSQMTFSLLSSEKLATNALWLAVTNIASETATPLGTFYSVTLPNPSNLRLFRLRR